MWLFAFWERYRHKPALGKTAFAEVGWGVGGDGEDATQELPEVCSGGLWVEPRAAEQGG